LNSQKIVHIIPTLGGGGAEILLGHIAIEQVKKGNEVHIIILEELHFTYINYPLKYELEKLVEIHFIKDEIKFSLKKRKFISKTHNLKLLINNLKPNIIHSHLYLSEIFSHLQHFKNVKYISHLHDNMHQFSFSKKRKLKQNITDFLEVNWLKKQYKKSNTKFIAISEDTAKYFKDKLPSKIIKNIFVLPNATNTKVYKSEFTEKTDQFKLISIGNLVPKKNHQMLIDVIFYLKNNTSLNYHLDILGFGPLHDDLQSKIDNLNLSKNITLHGNVSNVADFLTNSDIYIHTATYEPFGMVFIEAMASGLPIVSTNGKGNSNLIINNYNGFLQDDFDIEEFSKKIIEISQKQSFRRKLSENSLEFSCKYDIENYVKKLNEIYS
jgi:glycosyltransferase EpsD